MSYPYQHIFVSLDGGPRQLEVLKKAAAFAHANKAKLSLAHVVDVATQKLSEAELAEDVADYEAALGPELEKLRADERIAEVNLYVKAGLIREVLTGLVDDLEPDLVVCGARASARLNYAQMGSISSYLVRNVAADVLVVK